MTTSARFLGFPIFGINDWQIRAVEPTYCDFTESKRCTGGKRKQLDGGVVGNGIHERDRRNRRSERDFVAFRRSVQISLVRG
jgi:hypothetical protein